ncbi:FAD-binding protein [Candidatus Woesearchaeota archaeon]|nr:FAD-binding protein [Candidatus Woesearchaeota archaeon]
MTTRDDLKRLARCLPTGALLTSVEEMRPYECDGFSPCRRLPRAVALPENEQQVQAVLKFCHQARIPVVPRGAGTGLSGGALPVEEGIVLSLARLNRIIAIDPVDRCARVQPGVRNLAISEAAAPYGLHYAPDPSSQLACTIGGNVAENSGGVHCLKYGLTTHNLLELRWISADGEVMTVGGTGLEGPGYDVLALLTGSEGLLGVIVEIVVRLLPIPPHARVLLASFETIETAGAAVAGIIAAGIVPAGLELMDNASIRATEAFVGAGYPVDAAAIILCELDGLTEQVETDLERVRAVLAAQGALSVRVSHDEAERRRFWAGRKAAFPAVGRIAPDYYCMDGTIPRRHLAVVLRRIGELAAAHGLAVANVFHAGDGNLHPLILFDANQPGQLEQAEALGGRILETCIAVGGTITGEHGVGVEKINSMCLQFGHDELLQFHAVRQAFDPDGLLNPGKAIPTLNRCAEFGAMHVHGGQTLYPDLEHF